MKNLVNALLYQLTWLAAVAGAGRGYWWTGLIMLGIFAAWQLPRSTTRAADVQLMLIAAAIGFGIDSTFARTGLVAYATPLPWAQLAPVWIVVLWMSFALTMNHALVFLRSNVVLAALFGGIGGPLAYWFAGRTFGAAQLPTNPWPSLLVLALAWALVTPLLASLAALLVTRRLPQAHPAVSLS